MPWFKVDDAFWAHPKTLSLSNDAVALWVRAGSWSSQQLTDGRIAKHVLPVFAIDLSAADELVKADYWHVTDGGWVFHDWDHYQPSAADTKLKRDEISRKRADAGRKGAANRWQKDGKPDSKVPSHLPSESDGKPMAPSRPVPSRIDKALVQPAVERVPKKLIYPAEFEQWWTVYPRKGSKGKALPAFKRARKSVELDLLIQGAQDYALKMLGEEARFVKLPEGWLNARMWEDEEASAPALSARSFDCDRDGHQFISGPYCEYCGVDGRENRF